MASGISFHSAQANSVAITTPTAGDVIIVFAHRDGNVTPPTIATGYTPMDKRGANTESAIVGWKISDGTETTTGTWTNATSVAAAIYRGFDPYYALGQWSVSTASSATLSFGTFTMAVQTGTSWAVAFAAHRTATNVGTNAPTGMTTRSSAVDIAVFDTGAGVSSWSTQTAAVNATSGWQTYVIELRILPAIDVVPTPDNLVQHVCGPDTGGGRTLPSFAVPLPNLTKAGNTIVLSLILFDAFTASVTDDKSNTYTSRLTFDDSGDTGMKLWMFVADNVAADTRVLTVTVNDSGIGGVRIQVAEFYGLEAASFDVSHGAVINNITPTPLAGGSLTTTAVNDLIYQVAYCLSGSGTKQPLLSRICKDANMTLLSADLLDGSMAQYGIKATAGAFNPAFYVNPTGVVTGQTSTDKYLVGTLALKTNAANGHAATGKRVVRVQACNFFLPSGPTVYLQFPCTGNLQVLTWFGFNQTSLTGIDLNSVADGQGNTWASTGAPAVNAGSCSIFYSANPTAYPNKVGPRLTCAAAQEQSDGILYDMVGMDQTAPFVNDATATGLQNVTADLTTVTITPGNTDGIIIAVVNQDLDTLADLVGAGSGFFPDMMVYSGDDGGKAFYEDGGKGHYFNSNNSAVTFIWTVQGTTGGVDTWAARAASFKAASGLVPYVRPFIRPFPFKPGSPVSRNPPYR